MLVTPIHTDAIRANDISLLDLIDRVIAEVAEGSVLVVTSKIVSLCEGSVVPADAHDKEDLIAKHSAYYLPSEFSQYNHHFTIVNNTLVGGAGIDESNGDGQYVLWPANAQATANQVRAHLAERFGLQRFGVIVSDSTSQPFRLGASGIALAHSGFAALHDYIGQQDIFHRPFKTERANISGGLAAAAVVAMGEGDEQTPLCMLSDLPFVTFQDHDPTEAELEATRVTLQNDLFAPFFEPAPWLRGKLQS